MASRRGASLVAAASVAAVEALKDQAGLCRWNYILRSLHQRAAKNKNNGAVGSPFPQAKMMMLPSKWAEKWRKGGAGAAERARQTEESMSKVMLLDCWGPK